MIAWIYARLSSEDERSGIDGASVERQIENASAFATSHGWPNARRWPPRESCRVRRRSG